MDRQKKLLIFGGLGFRRAADLVPYAKTVAPQQEKGAGRGGAHDMPMGTLLARAISSW